MSRIGKLPIDIPAGVSITIDNDKVMVKGAKGELSRQLTSGITAKQEGEQLIVERPSDTKEHKAKHGLYRMLLSNMIEGVSKGYEIKLELVGVGFRASNNGQLLELSLGYSHEIVFQLPPEIKVEAVQEKRKNPVVTLQSIDKQLIGHVASKIRSFRPPEPYKGKGIRYVGEYVRKKAGKSASI
jgi:large subunit ribosomal protein L6